MDLDAGESDGDEMAFPEYVLGRGYFDANLAAALGVSRYSPGGRVTSQLILTDDGNRDGVAGDHTTVSREPSMARPGWTSLCESPRSPYWES